MKRGFGVGREGVQSEKRAEKPERIREKIKTVLAKTYETYKQTGGLGQGAFFASLEAHGDRAWRHFFASVRSPSNTSPQIYTFEGKTSRDSLPRRTPFVRVDAVG